MVLRMAKGDNHYAGHVDDDGGGWCWCGTFLKP